MNQVGLHQIRGFTIVELLVVISIIALLASMLLPSLSSARKAAQITICASQLRQQGVGLNAYAVDYRYFYPLFGGVVGDVGGGRTGSTTSWGMFLVDTTVYNEFGNYIGLPSNTAAGVTAYSSQVKIKWCPTVKWTPFGKYTFCHPAFVPYASGHPGYNYYTGRSMYGGTFGNFNTIKRRDNPKEILMTDQLETGSEDADMTATYGTILSTSVPWFNPHVDRSSQVLRSGNANHLTADGHVVLLDFANGPDNYISAFYAYSWFTGDIAGPASTLEDGPYAVIR
jgi:prepilin-type N-terminal cleavage/methylation domain-containing protein